MHHNFFVYILTNPRRTVLYIGVTNDLARRISEHKANKGDPKTFAGKWYCYKLIYYERYQWIQHAQAREKEIKKWSRQKKESLIAQMNPHWDFLVEFDG